MFDASLRTPLVYAIAVRYQMPLWRAGALLRAGCMAGFFVLLLWFPHRTWPKDAALLVLGSLLAVAVGVGVWLTGARVPHGLTGPAAGVAAVLLTLAFGLAQWRDELRRGYYTGAQAAAPTKIWHQVVVYPVMGYWLWTAEIGGLSAPGGVAVWAGRPCFWR